jgi:hypothetical protein
MCDPGLFDTRLAPDFLAPLVRLIVIRDARRKVVRGWCVLARISGGAFRHSTRSRRPRFGAAPISRGFHCGIRRGLGGGPVLVFADNVLE